jgi:SET domain-containing protein
MLYKQVVRRKSTIPGAGQGLFTLESIRRGDLVIRYTSENIKLITEEEFQREVDAGNEVYKATGMRWLGRWFCVASYRNPGYVGSSLEFYVNHSKEPNLFHVLGNLIALRDIRQGEELLMNYELFLPELDSRGGQLIVFSDGVSGIPVMGYWCDVALDKTLLLLGDIYREEK